MIAIFSFIFFDISIIMSQKQARNTLKPKRVNSAAVSKDTRLKRIGALLHDVKDKENIADVKTINKSQIRSGSLHTIKNRTTVGSRTKFTKSVANLHW